MNSVPIIYVVDDDAGSRESTCALVTQMSFKVEAYVSAEEFLAKYDGHRPGCLLSDYRMTGMNGVELVEKLRGDGITLSAVIMTAYADTELTVRAIRTGAVALLDKPFSSSQLQQALEEAVNEDRVASVNEAKRKEISRQLDSLTEGELEVAKRIAQGRPNKIVASELDVSIRTVESRRSRVFEKMHVKSVAELVQLAMIARPEICLGEDSKVTGPAKSLDQPPNPGTDF